MRVTPKISDSPAATRNSDEALARPLRNWIRIEEAVMQQKKGVCPPFCLVQRGFQSLRIARTSSNGGRYFAPSAKRQFTMVPTPFFFASCPT